jgi:tRNA-intron endonuclease
VVIGIKRKAVKKAKKASPKAKVKRATKTKKVEKAKIPAARLLVNKTVIERGYDELAEKAYGKVVERRLELAFVETLYLLEKGKIELKKNGIKITFNKLMHAGLRLDKRLHEKYVVYGDLRDRGLVVKTGFKFGCDFRVYKRGVTVKRGPKGPGEHTRWIVYVVPEDYTCAFQELSRAVRLAHSIRARMLWAIVDNENNVTYYEILRLKP